MTDIAVTEVLEALGSFEISLGADTPRDVLDAVDWFGHIAIVPGRVNPAAVGDGLLTAARYVGVVRSRRVDDDRRTKRVEDATRVAGVGMAFWLGDEDDKGAVYEAPVELSGQTFPNAIRALLPASGAVTEGTLYSVGATFTGETATGAGTSSTPNYLVASDADAADITISDTVLLYNSGGTQKEGTVFTVTAKPSAFGFTNVTFTPNAQAVTVAGDQLRVGTFAAYSGRHVFETPRTAIGYVCDTMSTTAVPVGWRVNGDATLDAGPESSLYTTTPTCVIVKRGAGEDMSLRALPGTTGVSRDVEDYSTRVVLLAEGEGESIATGSANISPATPYKDAHGNPVALTRLVSESDTTVTNADTRAAVALAQYTGTRDELELSTTDYDVQGSFDVGDYVWVYDPDQGLVDTANEVTFRGERINPIRLRVAETTWPVTAGYTVAYRAGDGTWYDLTDYIDFESPTEVRITVGEFGRALTSAGTEPVGSRPNQDTSTPAAPVFVEPFVGSAYLDGKGFTRARVIVAWNAPLNTDGSTVLDGDHYEIRYAVDTDMIYPATWSQIAQVRWMDLQTWAQPFAAPDGDWQTMFVAWGESTAQLQDLSPGVGYDVQIRAVDKAGNIGAWSPVTTFVASQDNIPPSTPAAPIVAASRIAVQVTHQLGKASGGVFNLESDLHHLEIHVDYEPTFTPSDSTLKAKVSATAGMVQGQIPVVATVQVEETSARYVRVIAVDITGNKSGPSDAASSTALLIDDAHISDLTVTKVTAGTISADWIVGARIKTADTGARAEVSMAGFEAYNAGGTRTFFADAATGDIDIIGQLRSGTSGKRLVVNPTGAPLPEIRLYPTTGSEYALISAFDNLTTPASAAGIQMRTTVDANGVYSVVAMDEVLATFGRWELSGTTGSYFAKGGYSKAEDDHFWGGWFSGEGGNYGGNYHATATTAEVGWYGATTANWNKVTFSSDGIIRHFGKFNDFAFPTSDEGIYTGSFALEDGTVVNIDYGPTMDSQLLPMYTIRDNIIHSSAATGADADGFQVTLSPAGSGAWSIYFWCFRI